MPYPHVIKELAAGRVEIIVKAWDNGKSYTVVVDGGAYHNWIHGMSIQNAFPLMDVETRELLISGTSPDDVEGIFARPTE